MSDPVATPDELAMYLGESNVDAARAEYLIGLAQSLCEQYVSPLPAAASAVVVPIAARAYTNATSAHQVSLGGGSVSFGAQNSIMGVGGMYLSRSDKIILRRMAGRVSAFSVGTLPQGVDAVQQVSVSATLGTFTLTFGGATTAPLAYNTTAADIESALQALVTVGSGAASATGSGPWLVEFTGALGKAPMPMLEADGSGLAGGTVSVLSVQDGVFAPGADLAPWNRDYAPNYLPGSVI